MIVRMLLETGELVAESALSIIEGWPTGYVRRARSE